MNGLKRHERWEIIRWQLQNHGLNFPWYCWCLPCPWRWLWPTASGQWLFHHLRRHLAAAVAVAAVEVMAQLVLIWVLSFWWSCRAFAYASSSCHLAGLSPTKYAEQRIKYMLKISNIFICWLYLFVCRWLVALDLAYLSTCVLLLLPFLCLVNNINSSFFFLGRWLINIWLIFFFFLTQQRVGWDLNLWLVGRWYMF